jgi:hypothetical protein
MFTICISVQDKLQMTKVSVPFSTLKRYISKKFISKKSFVTKGMAQRLFKDWQKMSS